MCDQDNTVGVMTGYGLNDWEVRVQVLVGAKFFSFPCCPDWFRDPYPVGTGGPFPGGKVARVYNWPLASN
jgi:hypothetical protein